LLIIHRIVRLPLTQTGPSSFHRFAHLRSAVGDGLTQHLLFLRSTEYFLRILHRAQNNLQMENISIGLVEFSLLEVITASAHIVVFWMVQYDLFLIALTPNQSRET
jgi:hypothetical protein